jgi:hypothetical protein
MTKEQQRPRIALAQELPKKRDHSATMIYEMGHEERLWNVSVLQRVHLSNTVSFVYGKITL